MSVTLRNYRLDFLDAHVYRGDNKVFQLFNYNHRSNYVTNNALVRCNRGEYIETKANITIFLDGSASSPQSLFTVMSVHQEGNYTEYYTHVYY